MAAIASAGPSTARRGRPHPKGMLRNLATTLRLRRGRRDPMAAYDAAPPELRRWLADAALPWAPERVMQLYEAELRAARGDRIAALAALSARQKRRLAADAARVWGPDHPAAILSWDDSRS